MTSRLRPQDPATNRRPGVLPGRRFALALVLALALLASAAVASADDAGGPIVTATIYAQGGQTSTDSVSLGALQADAQKCPVYTQSSMTEYRGSEQDSVQLPRNNPSGGTGTWPMSTILACMQQPVSLGQVTSITVLNEDGSPQVGQNSQLQPEDLRTPADFQDSSDLPVVSDAGSAIQYFRPWRGGDDSNYPDSVTTGGPLLIDVYEGPHLTVSATASASTVAAGTSVSFSASVTGNQGSPLNYDWSFGDNLPDSHDATPSVAYPDSGSYTVALQVSDTGGGGGATSVPITVTGSAGATPPTTTPSTPETTTGPRGAGTNPNGGTHGSKDGNGKGNGTRPSGGNGNHRGSPTQDQTGDPSPSSSHHQKPSGSGTGATGGSGASGGGSGSSSGDSDSGSGGGGSGGTGSASAPSAPSSTTQSHLRSSGRHRSHRAETYNRPSPTAASPGQLVAGRLVADVTPLSAGASPLVQRSPGSAAAALSRPRPTGNSPLPVIAGGLAIVLLLGLGAGRELLGPGWWRTLRLSS